MAFGDALKKFVGLRDYDEDYAQEEDNTEEVKHYDGYSSRSGSAKTTASAGKVMSLHETGMTNIRLHRFKGNQWQETVKKAANDFKDGCTVVINTEDANKDATTRVLDFLGGVVYALDGKMVRSSTVNYMITPYNCDIGGDIYDEESYHMDGIF